MEFFFAPDRRATPTFLIRSFRPGDGPLLAEATTQSYDHLHPYIGWARAEFPPDEAEQWVRRTYARFLLNEDFVMGVFTSDQSRLLGCAGFRLYGAPLSDLNVEISLWLHVEAAGHGLGTRILEEMLHWGFTDWPWQTIMWLCDSRNTPSTRLPVKVGMRQEGIYRRVHTVRDEWGDMLVFSITKAEWLSRQERLR